MKKRVEMGKIKLLIFITLLVSIILVFANVIDDNSLDSSVSETNLLSLNLVDNVIENIIERINIPLIEEGKVGEKDIIVVDKFNHLKGFKQIGFTIDYDGVAIESFNKEIVTSSEKNLKNRFRAQSIEVDSIYEEVDTGFFNVDEKPIKQTYILKNLLDADKNVKLNIMYEIDSDFVIWNGTEYTITNEPIYFEAFEVTEEMFPGLNETHLTGHTLYFGNNYYDFKDVVGLDYAVTVYLLNGKNYIDLEVSGQIDGLGEFVVDPMIGWSSHSISTSANGAHAVYAIDIDGDNDIDVLSASYYDNKIAWYENDGSSPPGWISHNITISANGASSVFAIDIDNDNDIDVLSASSWDDKIAWYESDLNDLSIQEIIPIQVVEDVDLVKSKTTLVRAVVRNGGTNDKNINVSLYFQGSLKNSTTDTVNAGQEINVDLSFIPDIAGNNKAIKVIVEEI